jgi:hypothetical protein
MSTDEELRVMRDYYDRRGKAYYDRYYGQLEGVVIEKFLGMQADDFALRDWPVFQVRYPDGEVHEMRVSIDEEGNGGGFLFLPYEPAMADFDAEKLAKGIAL